MRKNDAQNGLDFHFKLLDDLLETYAKARSLKTRYFLRFDF